MVTPDEEGKKAAGIEWTCEPANRSMLQHPSVYSLRPNILNWKGETVWRAYTSLTDVETVLRSLKSALGLRPIGHHQEQRADGHLFISVIAYQVIQTLCRKMKETGENASWNTVRDILRHLPRITTTFER